MAKTHRARCKKKKKKEKAYTQRFLNAGSTFKAS